MREGVLDGARRGRARRPARRRSTRSATASAARCSRSRSPTWPPRSEDRVASATFSPRRSTSPMPATSRCSSTRSSIEALEEHMTERGYLEGSRMATAFNMLRSERPDLALRRQQLPARQGAAAVRPAVLEFGLDAHAGGQPLLLSAQLLSREQARQGRDGRSPASSSTSSKVKVPIYNLATREDHIAPAKSVFFGSQLFGGPVSSCWPAPAISPASSIRRASRNTSTGPAASRQGADVDAWLAKANEHPGSWWPDWLEWLKAQDDATRAGARDRRRQAQADRGRAGQLREGEKLDVSAPSSLP